MNTPNVPLVVQQKKELTELGLTFEAIDIKSNPPKASLLKELLENSPYDLKKFFNTSGNSYRELGLKDKFDDLTLDQALDLLASDGMLIKRPLLVKDNKILQIGYRTKYKDLNLV